MRTSDTVTRTPRWEKWKHMPEVKLWEGVALSLDIEPEQVRHHPQNWMGGGGTIFEESGDFCDRVAISVGNFGVNKALTASSLAIGPPESSMVSLPAFAAWVLSLLPSWAVPADFSELANFVSADDDTQTKSSSWPWGGYETNLLTHLAAAAKKFWANYDPGDPTTAPTNQQVKDWLKERGVSDRTAEIMASILRADDLPTGPRK